MVGTHSRRVTDARRLLRSKERRVQGRFLFEGATLLEEAYAAGMPLEAVFATADAFADHGLLRELDETGAVPIFLVDERALKTLSDVASPAGIVAITHARLSQAAELFEEDGVILVLADLSDAGNAGTLVRSADAFGVSRLIFGEDGVAPYHPKVVRAAMGSLFRARLAVASPAVTANLAKKKGWSILGLAREGEPIFDLELPRRAALVVGHERRGLGPWLEECERLLAIPISGPAESLNAAVAGAIALYEASRP